MDAASFAHWVTPVLHSGKNNFLGCISGMCGYCLTHSRGSCALQAWVEAAWSPEGSRQSHPGGVAKDQASVNILRGTQHLSRAQLPLTMSRSYCCVCQLHLCSVWLSLTQLESTLTGLKNGGSLMLVSRKTLYGVSAAGRSQQVRLAAHSCRPSRNTKHPPGARARSLCLCSPVLVGSLAARASTAFHLALQFIL